MKGTLLIAFISLVLPAKAELTRDGAFDVLVDASLYQTKCYGYVSPAAKAALKQLGDVYNINLSDEIDAEKAVDRMAKRNLEIEQGPAALANFCNRERLDVEELDKMKHTHPD